MQEIRPDPARWHQLRQAWDQFQTYLDSDSPPPLTDSDVVLRFDADWQQAAEQYRQAKQQQEQAAEGLAHAKQRLIGLCQHPCQKGFGVRVAKPRESASGIRVTLYQEHEPC